MNLARLEERLRAAFPDRGEALARELHRWFDVNAHRDERGRVTVLSMTAGAAEDHACALCERPQFEVVCPVELREATDRFPGAFRVPGLAHFDDPDVDAPVHAVCNWCLDGHAERIREFSDRIADWPVADMVIADVRRAIAADDDADEIIAALTARAIGHGPRPVETASCPFCRREGVTVVRGPRAGICFACLAEARHAWQRALDLLSVLGRR